MDPEEVFWTDVSQPRRDERAPITTCGEEPLVADRVDHEVRVDVGDLGDSETGLTRREGECVSGSDGAITVNESFGSAPNEAGSTRRG
jgi:hypothetical protein